MAGEAPWSIRAAACVVGAVDRLVDTAMGALQAAGERSPRSQAKPPLAAFRKATALGAKGAKWTVAGVIGLGVLLMIGVVFFMPRAKPVGLPQTATVAGRARPVPPAAGIAMSGRDVIARRCRAGAYRGFPEIEKAECAGRLPVSPAPKGDAK
jgi:hypothetical protein